VTYRGVVVRAAEWARD